MKSFFNRKMAALMCLGFASGLPFMLTGRTLTVWARDRGVDLSTIGLFSLVTLPYSLKFLWAPLMDRYAPRLLGRRRGWILIAQLLLTGSIALMAWTGPAHAEPSLGWFAIAALCVAFFSASQDIVADAYRTDVLSSDELGPGASVFMTGFRLAMVTSGAGAVWLANVLPWQSIYLIAAAAMAVGIVGTILAPEPGDAIVPPRTFAEAVVEPVQEFFDRNGRRTAVILLFIIAFKLPDYMASKMTDPMLLDLGFTKTQIAFWGLGIGTAVTIPGVLIGGPIVARLGLIRALAIFGFAQALSNVGYLILANVGPVDWAIIAVIGVEYFCTGLVVAGFVAFLMSQCDKRYSATQYAMLSSVMALSSSLAGTPTGWLAERLGYEWFFLITILAAIPGMAMLPWLVKRPIHDRQPADSPLAAGVIAS